VRFPRFSNSIEDHGSSIHKSAQEEALSRQSDEALALARAIHGAGMASVASFALHLLKPLHWLGGQGLWILQPFVETLGARSTKSALTTGGLARFLEQDGGLEELALHLDRLQSQGEDGS
jgi:hypothetical protein